MYFVNKVTDKDCKPWIENFVKQAVRRSKFHGTGLKITIDKLIKVVERRGEIVIYFYADDDKYFIVANGLPKEYTKETMDNLLVKYKLMNKDYEKLKEGNIRIQWK